MVSRLRHVTSFERAIARNRLLAYFNGKLPLWDRQVSLTGFESMGYVTIAYVIGACSGVLLLSGSAVLFARGHSDSVLALEVSLYSLGAALIALTLIRWTQGLRAGRRFKTNSGPPP